MNIFYLDHNPKRCAQMHCDKHVLKMIIEYAQLMSTAHRVLDGYDGLDLMKATHANHPSGIWVRASKTNYKWLYKMWCWLLKEYTYRYGKTHACSRLIEPLADPPANIRKTKFIEPTPAMPEEFIIAGDSLTSYRSYYVNRKADIARWTRRDTPEWFNG